MKNILIIVGLLVVVVGIYLVTNKSDQFNNQGVNQPNIFEEENTNKPTDSVSGMRVEGSAVIVSEQRPGNTIKVAQVYLATPGYVVIHADTNGKEGAVLGSSALLPVGENNNVMVTLNRATIDGEKLWSMLHEETEGNTTFNIAVDTPLESSLGGPISGWFEINANADENVEVMI